MGKLVDNKQDKGTISLIYGASGAGKTLMEAGLARALYQATGRPLFIADWDFGTTVFSGVLKPEEALIYQPDQDKDPMAEFQEAVELAMSKECSGFSVDTLSTFGDTVLYSVASKNLTDGKETRRVKIPVGDKSINVPTQTDYRGVKLAFVQVFSATRKMAEMGMHVLWLAHERINVVSDADDRVKTVIGGAMVPGGQLAEALPKAVHLFARLENASGASGVPKRRLHVEDHGLWKAKDRLMRVPFKGVDLSVPQDKLLTAKAKEEIINKYASFWRAYLKDRLEG